MDNGTGREQGELWLDRPLAELADALRRRRVTAVALQAAVEARHARREVAAGAFVAWMPERARARAAAADAAFDSGADPGPLCGLPVAVKDIFGLAGVPMKAGCGAPLAERYNVEGPMVRALHRQLAVIPGKTHTVQFAAGGMGVNTHLGTPRNPWDPGTHRVAGGSSSGAGVSLGNGMAVLAFGSDTGGSVRVPAALTGNAGIKTSKGRWSCDGLVPMSPTLDTPGLLARSVADVAYGFSALDPEARADGGRSRPLRPRGVQGLRVAVPEGVVWADCGPGVAEAVQAALMELEAAGAHLVRMAFPELGEAVAYAAEGGLAMAELRAMLESEFPDRLEDLDPVVGVRVRDVAGLPAVTFVQRRERAIALARRASARAAEFDAVVWPTTSITAPALAEVSEIAGYLAWNRPLNRNPTIANTLNLCALTLPAGLDPRGLPIGLQLAAAHGRDDELLELGLGVEAVLGAPSDRIGTPPVAGL